MERSYGKEHGVFSDDDLYKVPFMRHFEIACKLLRHLASGQFDLLAANFPGADMIGHLVGNHFDACQQAVLSLDAVLRLVVPAAQANGWLLVVTSDHGNVEHYAPDHGNNDVLTTVMVPEGGGLVPQPPPADQARLFDIAWTILAAFGLSVDYLNAPPIPSLIADDPHRLVGVPLVRR